MKMVEVTVKFYGQLQSVVNEKSKRVELHHFNLVGGLVDTLIHETSSNQYIFSLAG